MPTPEPNQLTPTEENLEQHFTKIESTLQDIDRFHFFRDVIIKNLIGGIFWGLGATIGVSLLVTYLTIVASQIDLIPIIGRFVSDVITFILQHNHTISK